MPGSVVVAENLEPFLGVLLGPGCLRRGDVVPGRAVRLGRPGRGHHRHGPAPRLGGQPHPALAVVVRDQAVVPGERDGQFRPAPGGLDDALGVGVIADQAARHLQRGAVRVHPRAALGQPGGEPVPLSVGALAEPAQVDGHGVGAAHHHGERGRAQRSVAGAVGDRLVDVCHQARVGGERVPPGPVAGRDRDAGGQPPDAVGQRRRDRRAELVQAGDGGIDGLRPPREVRGAGGVPLQLRCVLPLVTGEVEPGHVQQRIAPVQLQVAQACPGGVLERGQMRLVVRVAELRARGCGRGHPVQSRGDPVPGQILDRAVVLVPPAELAHLSDVQVADRAQPGGELVHGWRRYSLRGRRPRLPGRRPALRLLGRAPLGAPGLNRLHGQDAATAQ